ncbi:hypothetical protein [Undibacterium sp. YM2]|uniref:hypothetical protein n=1 Tax=Undibacterium sp. YM2 TaxID=2058625 RepID=UPI001389C0F2|nr:hypothetical protein [Undibacterium sp. YM2]
MSHHSLKVGVWLFVFTVLWYLTGNFFLKNVEKGQVSFDKSAHVARQQTVIGSGSRAVIRALSTEVRGMQLQLVFDPAATQATLSNENRLVDASAQLIDGVFNIAISKEVAVRGGHLPGKIEIRLPSTVSKVDFFDVNDIQISGSLPEPSAELVLEFWGNGSRVLSEQLQVNHLKLMSGCKTLAKENYCSLNATFNGQIQLGKLEVNMQHGILVFSASTAPQQTLLNVGNDVIVTGRRDFLRSLSFSSAAQ